MRYIKLLLLLIVTLFSTFSFSSCNMNQSSNNTLNWNSSVEYSFDEEGIVSCVIRQDFYLNDVHYVMNLEKVLPPQMKIIIC